MKMIAKLLEYVRRLIYWVNNLFKEEKKLSIKEILEMKKAYKKHRKYSGVRKYTKAPAIHLSYGEI